MIYDGHGGEPYKGDIGIKDDSIMMIGDLSGAEATETIDAAWISRCTGFHQYAQLGQ